MTKPVAALAAFTGSMVLTQVAHAFCGFYVAPTDKPLYNDASMVALMREGTRTVLSMSNTYQGPPEDFAMVVPVPVVLKKDDVKTLPLDLFGKLETLTAPRLVEYWEQDPCAPDMGWGDGIGLGTIGGFGTGMGYGGGGGGNYKVKVEAQFAVGEYEIVVLSAEESDGLERWLVDHKYKIPTGAAAALAPYVKEQQKFFVAKVDSKKIKRDEKGLATLSPLRVSYESSDFRLPVRLGLLNSTGAQDLIVFILASGRYDAANYTNAFIPTNLDVVDGVRKEFHSFYGRLFDATLGKSGDRTVVTEYSWPPGTCDPCPVPSAGLTQDDVATLGGDLLYPGGAILGGFSPIRLGLKMIETGTDIQGQLPPEVIKRIIRANFPRLRACYQQALKKSPSIKGTVTTTFTIDSTGAVESASLGKGTVEDEPMKQCVLGVFNTLSFPEPEKGKVKVIYPIDFQNDDDGPPKKISEPLTITRLHTRYSPKTLGDDLVFKSAPPIVGGREQRTDGVLEKGQKPGGTNNFQARYAIRHPWTGPMTCEKPVRGRWGSEPQGDAGATNKGTLAAKDLAHAPRSSAQLSSLVLGGLDDPKSWDQAAGPVPAPVAAPAKPKVLHRRRACHCEVGYGGDVAGGLPYVAALSVLAWRRRRRSTQS